MIVEIQRGDKWQSYSVPCFPKDTTVMDVLDYIFLNLDHTLAYYRHSSCKRGICGRCGVVVDGKAVLACVKTVDPKAERIQITPMKTPIRDLVCFP